MMAKICGITNTADAFAAIACGAGALGFNFWPKSPRYIPPDQVEPLLDRLPGGILKIGLFVNEPPARILDLARRLSLDAVQVHGDQPLPKGVPVWKALSVMPGFEERELDRYAAEVFVLDTPAGKNYGGTGKTYDWSLVSGIRKKVLLAGGLDASNVREAIRIARPWGVDACSRLEALPGKKDHYKMAAFLDAALNQPQS